MDGLWSVDEPQSIDDSRSVDENGDIVMRLRICAL